MSVLDGPGEGTWSVFAEKVVEERDRLRDHVKSLEAQLECAQAFHDVAVKERDLARTQIASALREREELNRLRRLVPTGTYTLNVAHEEEIRLLREQLDEERANVEMLKTHVETLREAWHGSSETVTKLGEQLNASEADCERFGKLLDDCRNVLLGQYDPDSVNAMIHRIDDAIGPWESVAP